ncbi:MAG: type I restriction-modification system subunit M N-terminal domain-containing protein [Paludibacteraceae bacterium]|nr:type I restriction-modification system subunit M N-terminal domain-containing protein [Paludibacteraceae bacterium]
MAENTTAQAQREELHKTIWSIADSLRGAIDGWEFKSYILCTIFYRYISENLCNYINQLQHDAGMPGFDFAKLSDEEANDDVVRAQMVAEKGYYILPSQLFINVANNAAKDENLNETLSKAFTAIEASALGSPSVFAIRGLFSDFAVNTTTMWKPLYSCHRTFSLV